MDYVASKQSLLRQTGFALSKTYGRSMRPLIWGGEHCVAVAPLEGEPEVGDLLMFRYRVGDSEENVVHRLVEIKGEGDRRLYITRGDNRLLSEAVRREEIIGRVAEVHRMSGFRPWHIIPTKRFAVTAPAYRRYVRFWAAIWPARRIYYLIRGRAGILCYRMLSLFKKR